MWKANTQVGAPLNRSADTINMPNKKEDKKKFDEILRTLENLILTGRFRPGQRLVEADLVKRLSTSRYWVRDSLKILAEKGLVKIIPYKGAMVVDLSPKEIEDIFSIRVYLERLAVHQAIERLTPAHLKSLKQIANRFEDAHRQGDIQSMIRYNTEFHDYIFQVADNSTLMQLISDMRTRLHIIRYAAWSSPEVLDKIVEEHRLILKALKNKDLETLDPLIEKHISYSKKYYLMQLRTIEALIQD